MSPPSTTWKWHGCAPQYNKFCLKAAASFKLQDHWYSLTNFQIYTSIQTNVTATDITSPETLHVQDDLSYLAQVLVIDRTYGRVEAIGSCLASTLVTPGTRDDCLRKHIAQTLVWGDCPGNILQCLYEWHLSSQSGSLQWNAPTAVSSKISLNYIIWQNISMGYAITNWSTIANMQANKPSLQH